jgi:hypothetical protein
MKRKVFPTIALLLAASFSWAQSLVPERDVVGHQIRSARNPAVRIELPAAATYIGAHRWTLYDVADCELHVFVEADETRRVRRLYWIQFEGFVPTKPDSRYTYSNDAVTDFAGRPFHVRAAASERNANPRPGSDLEQVQRLVRERGYSLPDAWINVRLVNLFEQNRKELMLIFAEDMTPTGLTPADVNKGGKAEAQWPALEKQIIEAATQRMRIEWQD